MLEAYTVYYDCSPTPVVPYNPRGSNDPSDAVGDYSFSGGAGPVASRIQGLTDIRSGNPGEVNTVAIVNPIVGGDHAIAGISLTFRYVTGYNPPSGQTYAGPTFALAFLDAQTQAVVATVYNSPVLDKYSFDDFTTYSPPINVNVGGLSISTESPLLAALIFTNNQRNLQIPIEGTGVGLNVTITWN
jgi:hypothetical protein